ncbi:hypothetical protein Hanom_Chr15g01381731 [Helianthus anomalus]
MSPETANETLAATVVSAGGSTLRHSHTSGTSTPPPFLRRCRRRRFTPLPPLSPPLYVALAWSFFSVLHTQSKKCEQSLWESRMSCQKKKSLMMDFFTDVMVEL